MDLKTLEKNFHVLAEAPGGIERLRDLILRLAVQGRLCAQDSTEGAGNELLELVAAHKIELTKQGLLRREKPLPKVSSDDDSTHQIPSSWTWCRWGDVSRKIGDVDHKMPQERTSGYPYVSPRDFLEGNRIDFASAKKIAQEDFERLRKKIQPTRGDIIFPRYGTIGKNRLVTSDTEFLASYSCAVVKNLSGYIDPGYSFFYSISPVVKKEIERYKNKTTQANVGIKSIKLFVFPLPPLPEQKRIVAKVNAMMALCDELEAGQQRGHQTRVRLNNASLDRVLNADSAREFGKSWKRVCDNFDLLYGDVENLGALRQAVLQLAVQGKLVSQAPGDESTKKLLASVAAERERLLADGLINKVRKKADPAASVPELDLPSSWEWALVGDVCDVLGGMQKTPARTPIKNYYPYLRVANVQRGRLVLDEVKDFELQAGELDRFRLQRNDLLVVEGNGSEKEIGRCAIWGGEIPNCVHQNHIIRCRPIGRTWSEYILTYLNSPHGMSEMKQRAITTSGLYTLSVGKIRTISLPLPPLPEQKRIVAKVNELMALCDGLESGLQTSSRTQEDIAAAVTASMAAG